MKALRWFKLSEEEKKEELEAKNWGDHYTKVPGVLDWLSLVAAVMVLIIAVILVIKWLETQAPQAIIETEKCNCQCEKTPTPTVSPTQTPTITQSPTVVLTPTIQQDCYKGQNIQTGDYYDFCIADGQIHFDEEIVKLFFVQGNKQCRVLKNGDLVEINDIGLVFDQCPFDWEVITPTP